MLFSLICILNLEKDNKNQVETILFFTELLFHANEEEIMDLVCLKYMEYYRIASSLHDLWVISSSCVNKQ